MVNAASAQSKKELMKENENLKKENALMQAKFDSAEAAGILLQEELNEKTLEAEKLTLTMQYFEEELISHADTSAKDSSWKDKAIAWNDTIVHDQKKMLDLESGFVNSIVDGEETSVIGNLYKAYIELLIDLENKYKESAAFDEHDTFRKAMIDLVTRFLDVARNEYSELMEIYAKDPESLTDEDFERWELLTNIVDIKESAANDLFLIEQKVFALEYHFTLIE
ncbi:hypothetical protein SDC9_92255 [bioreactor metagenome]|uniref:Uncharacterized protein n=1 Tax=bioreactor metagenome TaxID=1076179 RepID=A0A644ZXT7_9ZZZZ